MSFSVIPYADCSLYRVRGIVDVIAFPCSPTDLTPAVRALAAAVAVVPIAAARADDTQGVASSRMSYSRFLEYLDMGRVKKVRPYDTSASTACTSCMQLSRVWHCMKAGCMLL